MQLCIGATGPYSFDCSGFTQYVYRHFGYTINRVADDQVNNGVAVDFANLQPGDLICFSNTYASSDWITHVGIYIGDERWSMPPTPPVALRWIPLPPATITATTLPLGAF